MSQLCDFCGHAIDHEEWCAKRLARAAVTLDEALPIAREAAERFPREYTAPPFYPHAWVLEAVAVALVKRNRERIRAEEAEARSKAHSASIAELGARLEKMIAERNEARREVVESDEAREAAQNDLDRCEAKRAELVAEITKLRANLTYQDERETVHSRTIAELTYARDGMFHELQALREATMLDPPENDWGKLTPAHVRQHVQDLADRVERMRDQRDRWAAIDGIGYGGPCSPEAFKAWVAQTARERDQFAARCEIAERENERLTADVAQLREVVKADEESAHDDWVTAASRLTLEIIDTPAKLTARIESFGGELQESQAFKDIAKLLGVAAWPHNVIDTITRQLEELARLRSDRETVMADLRKQVDEYRGHLFAIGDIANDRAPGFPAIVEAVRIMALELTEAKRGRAEYQAERDRLAREVKEMGEEMAKDADPETVLTAVGKLAAMGRRVCPKCDEADDLIGFCQRCGICNTCCNSTPEGHDGECAETDWMAEHRAAVATTFDWPTIAHQLFAAACPKLAGTMTLAKLGEEADRWISEVVSARRVKEIAHADNAKLVQQARELAARLEERRRMPVEEARPVRSGFCPECGTPDGADHPLGCAWIEARRRGMTGTMLDRVLELAADRIAAKVIG